MPLAGYSGSPILLEELLYKPAHLQPDSYDTDSLIGVLEQRAAFYAGHRVVLLWDGLSSHWSHKMRAHLDAQRDWLTVERLPAYAPELNPVEYLWAISRAPSWPTSVTTPWPRSPTRPSTASNGLRQRQPGGRVSHSYRPQPR